MPTKKTSPQVKLALTGSDAFKQRYAQQYVDLTEAKLAEALDYVTAPHIRLQSVVNGTCRPWEYRQSLLDALFDNKATVKLRENSDNTFTVVAKEIQKASVRHSAGQRERTVAERSKQHLAMLQQLLDFLLQQQYAMLQQSTLPQEQELLPSIQQLHSNLQQQQMTLLQLQAPELPRELYDQLESLQEEQLRLLERHCTLLQQQPAEDQPGLLLTMLKEQVESQKNCLAELMKATNVPPGTGFSKASDVGRNAPLTPVSKV